MQHKTISDFNQLYLKIYLRGIKDIPDVAYNSMTERIFDKFGRILESNEICHICHICHDVFGSINFARKNLQNSNFLCESFFYFSYFLYVK